MEQKANVEKLKKDAENVALQKETERDRKIRTIGNYVHESVPVSDNEVRGSLGFHWCEYSGERYLHELPLG